MILEDNAFEKFACEGMETEKLLEKQRWGVSFLPSSFLLSRSQRLKEIEMLRKKKKKHRKGTLVDRKCIVGCTGILWPWRGAQRAPIPNASRTHASS